MAVFFIISLLDTEIPLVHVGARRFGSAVQRPLAVFARKLSRSVIGILNAGKFKGTPPRSKLAENIRFVFGVTPLSGEVLAVWIRPGIGVPGSKEVSEGRDAVMQKAHRVTGADRALTFIAKQRVQKSRLKVR